MLQLANSCDLMQACFGPLAFFDVSRGRQERDRGASLMNHEEVKLIFTLLNFLFHHNRIEDVGIVAVLAAYKAQVCCQCPLCWIASAQTVVLSAVQVDS